LVLAVFVVHNDNHPPGTNLLDRGRYVSKCAGWRHSTRDFSTGICAPFPAGVVERRASSPVLTTPPTIQTEAAPRARFDSILTTGNRNFWIKIRQFEFRPVWAGDASHSDNTQDPMACPQLPALPDPDPITSRSPSTLAIVNGLKEGPQDELPSYR